MVLRITMDRLDRSVGMEVSMHRGGPGTSCGRYIAMQTFACVTEAGGSGHSHVVRRL